MQNLDSNRQEKINQILATIKLFSLLIFSIIIYTEYLKYNQVNPESYDIAFGIIPITIFIIIFGLAYKLWLVFFKPVSEHDQKKQKIHKLIEVIIFIILFSGLIIYNPYIFEYRLLFLFIITTSAIEFGLNYGFIISLISSVSVLIIDLISRSDVQVKEHFQNDLILVGLFLLIAWLIGYYEEIEREHREKITLLAIKDGLTDLYNHRFFYESLKQLIEYNTTSLSLLFIDIDNFKQYNDAYGHQAGDEVLKKISKILKQSTRPNDIVARYGGEEFTVILPDTDEEGALAIAENMRQAVAKTKFEGEKSQPNGRITISIGVSCYPDKGKDAKELINSADDALYRAKFFNKNRVEIYNSILEELKNDVNDEDVNLISSIKKLISAINVKDKYTYGHTERVVFFSKLLAEQLGLSEKEKNILKYGAYLHDIGKINIAKEILNKKTPLTGVEWNILQQHPVNGADLIRTVSSLKSVIPVILHHHERYDGTGYPDNLKGEEIPYLSRILTVADCFDAMTSSRPYQSAQSYSEAIYELNELSGKQFDPELVREFTMVVKSNWLSQDSSYSTL